MDSKEESEMKWTALASVAALALAGSAMADELYFNDFETDDGGWVATASWDPVGDWEWGDYDIGCLCLTLDGDGNVLGESYFTDVAFLGLGSGPVDGGSIVAVDGAHVHAEIIMWGDSCTGMAEVLHGDGDPRIEGQWSCPWEGYDGTVALDRQPPTCFDRTGVDYGC